MRKSFTSDVKLPVAMHDVELSDQDVKVILDAAKTPSEVVARLRKNPYAFSPVVGC